MDSGWYVLATTHHEAKRLYYALMPVTPVGTREENYV